MKTAQRKLKLDRDKKYTQQQMEYSTTRKKYAPTNENVPNKINLAGKVHFGVPYIGPVDVVTFWTVGYFNLVVVTLVPIRGIL